MILLRPGGSLRHDLHLNHSDCRRLKALRAVASVEFLKGLVVLLAGFGVLSLVHRDAWDVAESSSIGCTLIRTRATRRSS